MKKRCLFLLVVSAVIILTLLPLSFLSADPTGTTLTVTKDAEGESEDHLAWSVDKSVDQTHFCLIAGESLKAGTPGNTYWIASCTP